MGRGLGLIVTLSCLGSTFPVGAQVVAPSDESRAAVLAQALQDGATSLLTASIQSLTSFALLPDEQDYIFEPAELATLRGWKRDRTIGNAWGGGRGDDRSWLLLGSLGNTVRADAFEIGAFGPLGPGNVALAIGFDRAKSVTSRAPFRAERQASDAGEISAEDDFSERADASDFAQNLDLYLGYGLVLGDSASMGLSWRRIENDAQPADDADASVENRTDFTFDGGGAITEIRRQMLRRDQARQVRADRRADQWAVEFKRWSADEWSWKVRVQYSAVSDDHRTAALGRDGYLPFAPERFAFCYDVGAVACQYTDRITDADGGFLVGYLETQQGLTSEDLSVDGREWGASGRFDRYSLNGPTWQFDLGYQRGDYDFKNQLIATESDAATQRADLNFGDPFGTLTLYEDSWTRTALEPASADDLRRNQWFAGAECFWQWGAADLAVGLRAAQDRSDVAASGPWSDVTVDSTADLVLGDPPEVDRSVRTETNSGEFSLDGRSDRWRVELPISAMLRVSNRLALRFGAMYVVHWEDLRSTEAKSTQFHSVVVTSNGEVVSDSSESGFDVGDVVRRRTQSAGAFTLFRAGLEYRINDHLIAEAMATERTGDAATPAEQIGLDRFVVGVSISF